MKEDITKKLNVIQSRLDKGESIEEVIDSTFRNTTTSNLLTTFSQEKTKLGGTQLSFKEDF